MAQDDRGTLEKEIKEIISEIVEIDQEKITNKAKFVDDLGMDSMMALEILASIEKKYKIRISEDNLAKIADLDSVIDLVESFFKKK